MTYIVYKILGIIVLQTVFLLNQAYCAEKYIEIDSIVAIAETRTITKLELDNKKEKVKKTYLMQNLDVPNDKKIIIVDMLEIMTKSINHARNRSVHFARMIFVGGFEIHRPRQSCQLQDARKHLYLIDGLNLSD